MTFSRQQIRREERKSAARIDPACPPELNREISVTLAGAIAGREFLSGETLGDLVKRECPLIFSIAERAGFVLSFDLPENTSDALARGVIAYAVRKSELN